MGRDRNWKMPGAPELLRPGVRRLAAEWEAGQRLGRLWRRDASLWTGQDESDWLGWLEVPEAGSEWAQLRHHFAGEGLSDVILLGMGGSSLGSEVLRSVMPKESGSPRLHVVDSTDPKRVERVRDAVDLSKTVLISASKSGSTLETALLTSCFEQWIPAPRRIAITDPDSALARAAAERGYHATFLAPPTIGGRFSVLSPFGLVPAALCGRPVEKLLEGAREMAAACRRVDPLANPGCHLGLMLAAALEDGRYQLGITAVGRWSPFRDWLEQLLCESLGKQGRGFVPVHSWSAGAAEVLEIRIGPPGEVPPDAVADAPARLELHDSEAGSSGADRLGAEFFRWQFATAVCGAVMGVHPFDQPDVEAAKVATRAVTARMTSAAPGDRAVEQPSRARARRGEDAESPTREQARAEAGPDLFTSEALVAVGDPGHENARAWAGGSFRPAANAPLDQCLFELFATVEAGGYLAVLDYLVDGSEASEQLERWARDVNQHHGLAVATGRGPRYLHSTGQAFKGGPPLGVFLFLAQRSPSTLRVPHAAEQCGGLLLADVKLAQASGDARALVARGRGVLVLEFAGAGSSAAIEVLRQAVRSR